MYVYISYIFITLYFVLVLEWHFSGRKMVKHDDINLIVITISDGIDGFPFYDSFHNYEGSGEKSIDMTVSFLCGFLRSWLIIYSFQVL